MSDSIAPAGKEKARLFVAIFPPRQVVESLEEALRPFRREFAGGAIRWTPSEQVHFTLVFIGPVLRGRIPEFEAALETAVGNRVGGTLRAAGWGAFPNSARPRVVWAGLAGELEPVRELKTSLDAALQTLGVIPEEREFHPHLTIGRVNHLTGRERDGFSRMLESLEKREFGEWKWDRVDLMESVLGAGGAKYSVVKSCSLAALGRAPDSCGCQECGALTRRRYGGV